MADFFKLGTTAVYIGADTDNQVNVFNAGASSIGYNTTNAVVATDNALTTGSSVDLTSGRWFISAASSQLIVTPLNPTTARGLVGYSTPTGIATWQPPTATSGTDTAFASGTVFVGSIFVPSNKVLTGISFLLGSVGGTDKVVVQLNAANGALLANSTLTSSGTTAGTAANLQAIDFTAPVSVTGPARYWIGVSANGATAKLRTVPAFCPAGMFGNSLSQTAATPAAIAAPSTFTADKAPIAFVY